MTEPSCSTAEPITNFDDLYEDSSITIGKKRKCSSDEDEDSQLSLDEKEAVKKAKLRSEVRYSAPTTLKPLPPDPKEKDNELSSPKVYVGGLPCTLQEKELKAYFSRFGKISVCNLVRDFTTGISKGYAFITFEEMSSAQNALKASSHPLDRCKYMRVSPAVSKNDPDAKKSSSNFKWQDEIILPEQKRTYIGPLSERISNDQIRHELKTYGVIKGITRYKTPAYQYGYCSVEFAEPISIRRVFNQKISFENSGNVRITCSRFVMELTLNPNVIFFYEAYVPTVQQNLESHFTQYGKVFRAMQFYDYIENDTKTYGFVDFLDSSSVDKALEKRSQLISPGQFVRVVKFLPSYLSMNMFAIGDKDAQTSVRKLESTVPESGVWGEGPLKFNATTQKDNIPSSQVRFPSNLVPRLIGERGKIIAEISRDSKCKIIIPKANSPNIIVTIKGLKQDIKTAQYLMQKVIKGEKRPV